MVFFNSGTTWHGQVDDHRGLDRPDLRQLEGQQPAGNAEAADLADGLVQCGRGRAGKRLIYLFDRVRDFYQNLPY